MKAAIRVKPDTSEDVQLTLFKMGYQWSGRPGTNKSVKNLRLPLIIIDTAHKKLSASAYKDDLQYYPVVVTFSLMTKNIILIKGGTELRDGIVKRNNSGAIIKVSAEEEEPPKPDTATAEEEPVQQTETTYAVYTGMGTDIPCRVLATTQHKDSVLAWIATLEEQVRFMTVNNSSIELVNESEIKRLTALDILRNCGNNSAESILDRILDIMKD